jgi:hypothetical protein
METVGQIGLRGDFASLTDLFLLVIDLSTSTSGEYPSHHCHDPSQKLLLSLLLLLPMYPSGRRSETQCQKFNEVKELAGMSRRSLHKSQTGKSWLLSA